MGVHDDGLRVGVADDTYSLLAMKLAEFILEFRTEIISLQTVDRTAEAFFGIEGCQTGTARA